MTDPNKLTLVTPGLDRETGGYLDWGVPAPVLAQFLQRLERRHARILAAGRPGIGGLGPSPAIVVHAPEQHAGGQRRSPSRLRLATCLYLVPRPGSQARRSLSTSQAVGTASPRKRRGAIACGVSAVRLTERNASPCARIAV
jgi:hypothetical protein